ncbi:MAG: hypothetical protein MRY78_10825 [Saprospiraceae bacterium]|nr:hypothetical protein [Saprospiraceae bacterium]
MALLRFFRQPKHQRYDYKPRFWDKDKEALEERIKRIEQMQNSDPEAIKSRLEGSFKRGGYLADNNFRRAQVRRSNYILIAIIAALILFSYVFLSLYLPRIVEALGTNG